VCVTVTRATVSLEDIFISYIFIFYISILLYDDNLKMSNIMIEQDSKFM